MHPTKSVKDVSWETENKQLQDQAESIHQLRKQITKQSEVDTSVQMTIARNVDDLKHTATLLAQKLEKQKLKHTELETIIQHLKVQLGLQKPARGVNISNAKLERGTSSKIGAQEDLQSLDKRIKKMQYDLDQINIKANKTAKKIKQQKSSINLSRTQRVIDSVIFRNIEKELTQSEVNFKKLLIDHLKYEKQYNKLLDEYNKIKAKALNLYEESKDKKKISNNAQDKFMKDAPQINVATIDAQNPQLDRKFTHLVRLSHSKISLHKTQQQPKPQNQEKAITHQLKVKKLLSEVGLSSGKELIEMMESIDQHNNKQFIELNQLIDQSNQIQRYLAEAEVLKKNGKAIFNQHKGKISSGKKMRMEVQQIQAQIQSIASLIETQSTEFEYLKTDDCFLELLSTLQINLDLQNFQPQVAFRCIEEQLNRISPTRNLRSVRSQRNILKNNDDRLQELISKVKRFEESQKIMKQEDFKEQYRKLIKSTSQTILPKISALKRKSNLKK